MTKLWWNFNNPPIVSSPKCHRCLILMLNASWKFLRNFYDCNSWPWRHRRWLFEGLKFDMANQAQTCFQFRRLDKCGNAPLQQSRHTHSQHLLLLIRLISLDKPSIGFPSMWPLAEPSLFAYATPALSARCHGNEQRFDASFSECRTWLLRPLPLGAFPTVNVASFAWPSQKPWKLKCQRHCIHHGDLVIEV